MKSTRSLLAALLIVIMAFTMSISAFAAYNDVDTANDNLEAIEFVDRLGILQSTWNGDFEPEQYFTRADAVKAAYKMLYGTDIDPTVYDSTQLDFTVQNEGDIETGSTLASYLQWAVDNYLITTNVGDSMFRPAEAVTANELMTLLAKILRLTEGDDVTYPDDYTSAVKDLVGDIEAGDNPVTREQAAVAIANALVATEDGKPGEIGVYKDYDGTPLTSLAATALRMSAIDLVIRATVNRPLGFEVKNGVLLSNGMDVELKEDLSEYVGYSISITYCDEDNSGTLTEDEKVLTYTIGSASSSTVPFSSVSITSGNNIAINIDSAQLSLTTATYLYLNDSTWPIGDEYYDLTSFATNLGTATSVPNRPNFKFKCMYTSDSTSLTAVFATETIPAKIIGINNGIYSVYDYYKAGTDEEIQNFSVTDCSFSNTVKVGDYVNYYVSNGKCYFTPGTTYVSAIKDRSVLDNTAAEYDLSNGTHLKEHAFFNYGSALLEFDKDENTSAPEYVFIVEDSGENYMLTWEKYQTNHAGMFIDAIEPYGNKGYTITATDVKTNVQKKFDVLYDNIDSTKDLAVGDYINYSDNGVDPNAKDDEGNTDKKLVIYVKKTSSVTIDYIDMGNYLVDSNTGKIYYKNNVCNSDAATSGTAELQLDMAKTVVKINAVNG